MEQIIINKPDGTQIPLFSRANFSAVSKATQKVALLSDDLLNLTVTSAKPLPIDIGDYITIFGRPYTLNQLPGVTKSGLRSFEYDLQLEGLQYKLIDVQFKLPEGSYGSNLYGDLNQALVALKFNLDRVMPGKWEIGTIPQGTKYTNLDVDSGKNCLFVIQELCREHEVEFNIDHKTKPGKFILNFATKVGVDQGLTFQYGRGLGLYKLQRSNINTTNICTRLFVYGSSENIPSTYRHTKLCLPSKSRLLSYIESAEGLVKYGIKENENSYDDYKPERVGTVTAVTDRLTFADADMFDLTEKKADGSTRYLIQGTAAKITFQTGGLAGYSFDVHSYNHATKTFVINEYSDENGLIFPSSTSAAFQVAVGDTYILEDINLPDSYITDAEQRLLTKATSDFAELSQPQVTYKLTLTDAFFEKLWGKTDAEILHVGDRLHIIDTQMGVDKQVRITRIERDLLKPHAYDLTLSDTVETSQQIRTLTEVKELQEIVQSNNLKADPKTARRNWRTTQELMSMVFDPEGDYYSDKIKPLSIDTTMLSVGAKSQQFVLKDVIFKTNEGSYQNFSNTAGQLVHYGIAEELKTWSVRAGTFTLDAISAYYIYIVCPKDGSPATVNVSTRTSLADVGNNYYFLVGTISSPQREQQADGSYRSARFVSLTYGYSTINGRFVTTGRINSTAGTCYFDLDNNEIGGVIQFVSGTTGALTPITELENKADEATEYINVTLPGQLNTMQGQIDGKVETSYQSADPSGGWTTAEDKAKHVGDQWFNTSSKRLYYYLLKDGAYQWAELKSQDAIDAAAAAAKAQDTADGKRRIFVTTPTTPYDVGDLWLTGGKTDGTILACRKARAKDATPAFLQEEWEEAVYYDNTKTTIDGGVVTSGTIRLAGDDATIKAGVTGKGTEDTSVRFWAGASEATKGAAPYRVLQDGSLYATKATISGKIDAETGSIGGFSLKQGCIGSEASSTAEVGSNLTLMNDFIKFADSNTWASIGTNVLPSSTGVVGVGRFTNTTPNSGGTNYGLLVTVTGALKNYAILAKGSIIGTNVYTTGFATITPEANTAHIPGDMTVGGFSTIIARFINSGGGIGLPSRQAVAAALGISDSTPFAFPITVIASADSTQTGFVVGRNSDISGMSSTNYPQRLDNNATVQTGKHNMANGDTASWMLVYNGSTYYAYWLSSRY